MQSNLARWLAIEDHTPDASQPLRAAAGEVLGFERRPTEWDGWLWCANSKGYRAWVPEAWVSIDGTVCKMRRDYTSLELDVCKGEVLVVEETESGWAWVENSAGRKGWVPLGCLEKLPEKSRPA